MHKEKTVNKTNIKSFCELADENFKNGFSCSESIVKAGVDLGVCDESLIGVSTSFSGGMSSGCLCGAIAGSQMLIGVMHGKGKTNLAREKASDFIKEFTKAYKATCCRILTKGIEFGSVERKANCAKLVNTCAEILEKLL